MLLPEPVLWLDLDLSFIPGFGVRISLGLVFDAGPRLGMSLILG